MAKRRHIRHKRSKPSSFTPQSKMILLDLYSSASISQGKALMEKYLKFHWDYYQELAYQRSQISSSIKKALLESAQKSFRFEKWQRAVKYKYSLEPLSTKGSLTDPGGRFNIGEINTAQFPPFPALYLASDKNTALQELLGQKMPGEDSSEISPLDLALTRADSIAIVSVSGMLGSIINLKKPETLQSFVDLIKGFTLPDPLKKAAQDLKVRSRPIKTVRELMDSVQIPNWRLWPMQFDVPSSSQVFGQLVAEAGVEGILYSSKFSGGDCLAVFPQNFESGSFVSLDDPVPKGAAFIRLDSKTKEQP